MEIVSWDLMYQIFKDCIDGINNMYSQAVGMFDDINPFNLSDPTIGGSYSGAANLKAVLQGVSDTITGIALPLCVLFFLLEFFKKSMDLQWVKWENIFMFLLKLIFAKIILSNSMGIMEWIYTLFNDLAINVNNTLTSGSGGTLIPIRTSPATDIPNFFLTSEELALYRDGDGGFLGLGRLIKIIQVTPSIFIAQGIMMITGVIIFARVFEVIVYTMVAPIPLSSFVSEEHRQIGISFIKSYAAVCLQALIIVVMFAAFAALGNELDHLQGLFASGSWGILLKVALLGMGVIKSGGWAKKLCGAM